ncbi:hypothetical protein [Poseidonocella sedimentorum]|uniref:Glutamine amidotransferase n=1 Tax=Poseidonocella sedimentorum TaxID=871652 RepID=A0A1I6EBS5_9RHOB|nr:hypothetical protein [Poseidonocella sedimentorum]SFR15190.1 hypothetical protein SAMN04515673_10995 [Poseidonocella sedimentorum]
MTRQILLDPLLGWPLIWAVAALAVVITALALWRGLAGWWLRGLAGAALLAALLNPSLQTEDREALSDIVLLAVDRSASQTLGTREDQTTGAAEALAARIEARPNTELRRIEIGDGAGDAGTQAMTALAEALAQEPLARVAGMILVSDGHVHDLAAAPALPAPLHLIETGESSDWDRRLMVENAPAFAILGEPVTLSLMIEDSGASPAGAATAPLEISVDGAAPLRYEITIGRRFEVPIVLEHGGRNVLHFRVPAAEGELTDRNNEAVIQINGVRDRLRVLLVSGEPHPGERTWRNLLKSDSSVDLVHFTILRPPEKQDGVPVDELSLIAFPTRELFLDKIDDFDLIIFDRYQRRGILPAIYLDNVSAYVENGGAVLVAAGPDFASADSLYRSPLARILPGAPTARVIEAPFLPRISETGQRHPVTEGLSRADPPQWGRWFRHVEVVSEAGDVVMTGAEDRPLLILNRVGEGRVALLASDHAWLWNRGFEGGGPQLELLRRLSHWMMKEPELEEEALWAEATGQQMRIIRRSLGDDVGVATVTSPSGEEIEIPLEEVGPGRFEALYDGPQIGLYRITEGAHEAVIGLGPAAPREFEATIATGAILQPLIDSASGGVRRVEDGVPALRDVRPGRPAAGRGWIGLTPREAYVTADVTQHPLFPAWAMLLLASGFIIAAWLREGRR